MTNKTTKRALLTSVMALFLCFTMLLGTTFAWFTDSVTSAGNKIIAGTLDVELLMYDGEKYVDISESSKPIFGSETSLIAQNNNADTLWEPGKTQVAYLAIKNAGSLALKYSVALDVENVSKDLYEVMEYAIAPDINAEEGGKVDAWDSANAKKVTVGYNEVSDSVVLNKGDIHYFALSVHMDENAGNDYQDGEVSFDLTVLATQLASEEDSFGPDYDENAPLLTWKGDVDSSWYVAGKDEYVLDTPAKLAGLAELVNSGVSFSGVTIKLGADMNLDNVAWTPIGVSDASFNGSFNGNGYTIYNLNVTGTEGVGLIGFAGNAAHIEKVRVVNANVVGTHYVGTVLGYGYLAANCLKYCAVENAKVVANDDGNGNGDKVGAVAGWTANGNIIGNMAKDCTIFGCRDIGGIVGYVNGENRAVNVSGNVVENVAVAALAVDNYAEPEKLGTNVSNFVGRSGSAVTIGDNSGEIEKVSGASTSETLKNSLENAQSGDTVYVSTGEYTFPASNLKAGVTLECDEGTVFEGSSNLNANGATIVGATFSNPTGSAGTSTVNGTYKDCTFTGANGLRWCYAGETVVFENCTFSGDVYGVHFDGGANNVVFKNCVFSGFNAMGGAIELATFEGCTFKPGRSGYNGINMWGNTEMKDCTFVFDGTKTEWVDLCGENKNVSFTNCVVTDGDIAKGIEIVVGDYGDGNTIIIDGVYYALTAEQLRNVAANATGDVEILLGNNITLGDDTTQKEMGAYFSNATSVTILGNGKTLTLKGPMPGNDWQAQYYSGIIAPNASVTVKDLTIVNEKLAKDGSNISADRKSVYTMVRGTNVLFENVDFVGGVQVVNNTKFAGCTFEENVLVANDEGYATNGKFCVFIDFEYNADGVCTVDFEDCTFDASGYGCVKAAGDKGANITVNVKDCSFTNTCPSNSWSQETPKYDVKTTGSSITVNDIGGNDWSDGANAGIGEG